MTDPQILLCTVPINPTSDQGRVRVLTLVWAFCDGSYASSGLMSVVRRGIAATIALCYTAVGAVDIVVEPPQVGGNVSCI